MQEPPADSWWEVPGKALLIATPFLTSVAFFALPGASWRIWVSALGGIYVFFFVLLGTAKLFRDWHREP
ncbi:hypothetical protein F4553_000542 [Allocatelliglobosispora scoriae]|uniref:Uncharacterized protein n=1 Tax=Allocatelliglobosispora scoriae TaxID=643052 RepID=A0A841BJE9_9ACTN|nr:hypothetical protein [Allocatelliglobosispora scoriae]MBB5867163.1 hypothetical protein [Allocatelliglobosispora scoriae]